MCVLLQLRGVNRDPQRFVCHKSLAQQSVLPKSRWCTFLHNLSVCAWQYYVSHSHQSTQVRSCYSGMPPPSYPGTKQYNNTNCHGNIFQCRRERMSGVYTANYSHSLWPMFRVLEQEIRFMSDTGRSGWWVILSQG